MICCHRGVVQANGGRVKMSDGRAVGLRRSVVVTDGFSDEMGVLGCFFDFYSASALLAMQSTVLARGILSVCLSVTFR